MRGAAADNDSSSLSHDHHVSAGEEGNDALSSQEPLTQEDVSLNVIRNFVENFFRRSLYERALLEDRNALRFDNYDDEEEGVSALTRLIRRISGRRRRVDGEDMSNGNYGDRAAPKLGTISIPSPGVPRNMPVNLDVEILSLVSDDGREGEGYGG